MKAMFTLDMFYLVAAIPQKGFKRPPGAQYRMQQNPKQIKKQANVGINKYSAI